MILGRLGCTACLRDVPFFIFLQLTCKEQKKEVWSQERDSCTWAELPASISSTPTADVRCIVQREDALALPPTPARCFSIQFNPAELKKKTLTAKRVFPGAARRLRIKVTTGRPSLIYFSRTPVQTSRHAICSEHWQEMCPLRSQFNLLRFVL